MERCPATPDTVSIPLDNHDAVSDRLYARLSRTGVVGHGPVHKPCHGSFKIVTVCS